MIINSISYLMGVTAIMLLSACSAHIPPAIKQPLQGSPDVSQVRQQVAAYQSQKVRWGGFILDTENKQNTSELTIVALPLDSDGEPRSSDQSPGRFIAIVDDFLEPLVYAPDRMITVTGRVTGAESREVGEFSYEYPVIRVEQYYLWPAKSEAVDDYYPYYPWLYDPFYPMHYPYSYPHHHHR